MWRVYLQIDGLSVDTLVVPGNPRRLILDFAFHILEVRKLAPWDVMEFSPFALCFDAGRRMGHMNFASFRCVIVAWDVDKLQNEGSPSNYAATPGQEVPTDNILQHRRFAGGLGANDDLGKLLAGENICGRLSRSGGVSQFVGGRGSHCR